MDYRIIIKFLVEFGNISLQIQEMLSTVYENNAYNKTALFKWIKFPRGL